MALLILNMPCSNSIRYTMKNFLFLTPEIIALDAQKRNEEVRTCISTITLSIFPYNTIYFFFMYLLFLQPTHALICSCDLLLFSSFLGIINIGKNCENVIDLQLSLKLRPLCFRRERVNF